MKIKIMQPKNTLACEGELSASVKSVKAKGDNNSKVSIEFCVVCNGGEFVVAKDYALKLEPKTELYKDAQTILARPFAEAELSSGEFDTETLTGLACRVVVVHRRTSGGKTAAVVTAVLPKD